MRAATAFLIALIFLPLGSQAAQPEQLVVCEVSYLNHAWGFQHSGVYIDPKGSIGEFNYSAADSQWAPNRGQSMTQSDLQEKYRPGNRVIGKVCPHQMIWLRDELNKVRYAPTSKPTPAASDAGTNFTQCWMFESETAPGQTIRLRETGDFESRNLADAAPALANWIEAVVQDASNDAHIPLKSKGCIAFPESLHQQYDETIQQSEEDRNRAMKTLTCAEGLRCRMGEGRRFDVYGATFEQRPTPENFEMNNFQLDFRAGTGRTADSGDEVHQVRARVNGIGIVLEDNPMDGQEIRTTTIIPYRISGQNRFPAVMHEVLGGDSGLAATTYIGACTVIPRP
ncbi:MAG: hypothetical protein ACRETY_00830 [Steroidobacteraceae bacterium]